MVHGELRQRLTSILAADVVGYSRLMGIDELGTLAGLEAARQVFRAEIASHQGRVIDMAGDSILAVFESATGAVAAAVAIQQSLHAREADVEEERRMRFRIGVHLGDVFEKADGTIYGDGVNIAARLEGLAAAGGIALSDAVEGAVRGKASLPIRHHGARRVKNVARPVDLYTVELPWQTPPRRFAGTAWWKPVAIVMGLGVAAAGILFIKSGVVPDHGETTVSAGASEVDPRSVAVLPFADLSEGKDQSYFSDGLSEEVIGRLAQIAQLRVIARTSSFVFKDSRESAADIAGRLHVATLLEGSVRRSGDRIRVTAQLIKAADSSYLWSGTYERRLTDVFAIQDEIANAVVTSLKVNLNRITPSAETIRYVPKPDAYDQYLRGRQLMRARPENYEMQAVDAFTRAVALDEHYGAARSMLAFTLSFVAENEADPAVRRTLMDRALAAAERAVQLAPAEPDTLATRGFLRFAARWDCAGADADFRQSLQLDPNAVPTLTKYGYFLARVGRSDEALSVAQRIKTSDPFFAPPWELESSIQSARGDYASAENSLRHARSILQLDPDAGAALAVLALLKGDPERAKALFEALHNAPHRDWGLALANRDLGNVSAAESALRSFTTQSPYEFYNLAEVYARARQLDAAFEALERALDTHDPSLDQILIDPLLASLHADPRFDRLLVRMGFPSVHAGVIGAG
jgi:adenylate cyclase